MKKRISMEEFATIHNSSKTKNEAIKKSGLSPQSFYLRVLKLKKHNIPLKRFPKTDGVDWEAVRAAAEKALK